MLDYAEHGEVESMLAHAFIADAIADLAARLVGRDGDVGRRRRRRSRRRSPFVAAHRAPAFLESLADELPRRTAPARRTSPTTSSSCARRSTASPRTRSAPSPSTSTAPTPTSPRTIIAGLAELGGFGLSVPEEYGGFAAGGESDYLGMVVATEELSWGSLGVGGSLITRPEILTRAHRRRRHRGAEAARGCRASRPAS